jgi:hypothetical protein
MGDPAVEIDKLELGDNREFLITLFKRPGTMSYQSGQSRNMYFYSFTIRRKSPVDGKVHQFFREKDIYALQRLLPTIDARLQEIKKADDLERNP